MTLKNELIVRERYNQISPVLIEFTYEKIPFVIHKGAVLSKATHNDPFHRVSNDIDIIIPIEYCSIVESILKRNGFEQKRLINNQYVYVPDEVRIRAIQITHQMVSFIKETDNVDCPVVEVDVNIDIFWGRRRSNILEFLSDRKDCMLYDDIIVPTLSPVKLFFTTCLHHYRDMFLIYGLYVKNGYSISHFEDIQRLLTNLNLSTEDLIALTNEHQAQQYIYTCLYATKVFLSESAGQHIMDALYKPGYEEDFFHFGGFLKDNRYRWPDNPVEIIRDCRTREILNSILDKQDIDRIHQTRINDIGYDDLLDNKFVDDGL